MHLRRRGVRHCWSKFSCSRCRRLWLYASFPLLRKSHVYLVRVRAYVHSRNEYFSTAAFDQSRGHVDERIIAESGQFFSRHSSMQKIASFIPPTSISIRDENRRLFLYLYTSFRFEHGTLDFSIHSRVNNCFQLHRQIRKMQPRIRNVCEFTFNKKWILHTQSYKSLRSQFM